MLGNFMEDIGITPDQFERACTEGKNYQMAFDQVFYMYYILGPIKYYYLLHNTIETSFRNILVFSPYLLSIT